MDHRDEMKSGFMLASQINTKAGDVDHKKKPVKGQVLLSLLRLRQCCSHVSLMKSVSTVCLYGYLGQSVFSL